MTAELPLGLALSFTVATAEIGMFSAARLFVEEIALTGGRSAVEAARDVLGRRYAVFDAIASQWLSRGRIPLPDPAEVACELADSSRVLIVGAESDALDRLVPMLPDQPIALVSGAGGPEADLHRVAANYPDRIEVVSLGKWTAWAGSKSALLTFVYGADDHVANVSPAYLRLVGPDVRASFRTLLGWNLLGARPRLHPLHLAETNVSDFSVLVAHGDVDWN